VHPGVAMPAVAQGIHGITDAALANAPPLAEVLPHLRGMLDGSVMVAHNAAFDAGFLSAAAARLGVSSPVPPDVLCTLKLARHLYGFHSCSLAALSARLAIPQPSAHRALADAETALAVLAGLVSGLDAGAPPTGRALLDRIAGRGRGGHHTDAILARIRAARAVGASLTVEYTTRRGEGPLTHQRRITPTRLRPPHIEAWCHLRGAPRVFHLKRIVRIVDDPTEG
jgi:DNA polymerase-3 subunit epsilon